MKKVQTKIYSYGVSQVESALACDAPGPLPRRDPTSTTSRTVHRKQGTGLSNRTVKQITGQKNLKPISQDLAERKISYQNKMTL